MRFTARVPRLNYRTGGYTWDDNYVWDSWANFQWVGFLTGRLWLLHLLTREQRYGNAAMQLCERIGPVLARHPTAFSSTGIDMYYALTLGYQITKREDPKKWDLAGGDNFANIFDKKGEAQTGRSRPWVTSRISARAEFARPGI
jgi:unsaturated chondroitin disaccharide hydrolase